MDYKIKKKRIMGKGEYGLISDNLTPVSEFKYLSITKDGLYYFMQHVDGKLDVFVGSQIIETDYTSLEFVPFGSKTLCVGRNEKRIDIVEFRKDSNEVSCVVLNESIFGSTKIDDIKICSEFVELYQNTNDGVLKGFLYHPLFGNMKPKYCDIEGYRYEAGRPFYPNGFCRSPENSEWSQECVYAIVTALVDGKKKKGIITRVRKYSWIDSFKYVWEEVEPCVHDDIIREDDLKFKLVDYIAGKRKVSLLKACTYYKLSTQGRAVRGYPHLKINYTLPPADSYTIILSYDDGFLHKKDAQYFEAVDEQKYSLYRVAAPLIVRGSLDYLMKPSMSSLKIDKLINGADEKPKKIWATEDLNIFKARKGEGFELVFDKFDTYGSALKKEIGDGDVEVCFVNGYRALLTVPMIDSTKKIILCKPLDSDWLARTFELVESEPYKSIKTKYVKYQGGTTMLLGIKEDGTFDVYSPETELIAEGVNTFDCVDDFFVSTKNVDGETEYRISLQSRCVYKCKSKEEFEFHYNAKEKLLLIRLGNHLTMQNLQGRVVLEGDYKDVKFSQKIITCNDDVGTLIFKYDQDGNISPLIDGHFASAELVVNETRIIISYKKDDTMVFGVLETMEGNICIDFEYDHIVWENDRFVCNKNDETVYFDADGYLIEEPVSDIQKGNAKKIQPVDKKVIKDA